MNHKMIAIKLSLALVAGLIVSGEAMAEEKKDAELSVRETKVKHLSDKMTGTWEGEYQYSVEQGLPPVKFILTLTARGTHLNGKISEPNTFGDANSSFLRSNIEGNIDGDQVRFT